MITEELKTRIGDVLKTSLSNDNALDDMVTVIESRLTDNAFDLKDFAQTILDAYNQGVDVFWKPYHEADKKAKELEMQVAKIKDRLFDDFLKE